MTTDPNQVASTTVHGRWWVSTINVGYDMSAGRSLRPLIYETVIFDQTDDSLDTQWSVGRYATTQSAKRGHNRIVKQLREGWTPIQ